MDFIVVLLNSTVTVLNSTLPLYFLKCTALTQTNTKTLVAGSINLNDNLILSTVVASSNVHIDTKR